MTLYRKRPISVQAFQMTADRMQYRTEWPPYLRDAWAKPAGEPGSLTHGDKPDTLEIFTLEGPHVVTAGAWIVQGSHGEIWAVQPDIFAETYEEVT